MSAFRHTAALMLAACALHASAASLDSTEERIVAAVKTRAPQAIALLERAVRINSGTMNHAGVRAVGQVFAAEFEQLGFATRWIDMPPEMQRAGHLVATRSGSQGRRLLLLGHLDTVFEPGNPAPVWEWRDGRIRGQGVSDMKGGDVVVVEALRALQAAGALDNTSITVMFTGDEENAGDPKTVSRRDMQDAARRSDVALAFEGTVLDAAGRATATVGRRSSSQWELRVTGRAGHSSALFRPGASYGAIFEAARILDTFRREVPEPDLSFNPGLIVGGSETGHDEAAARGSAFGKTNVIAHSAVVTGDLRYLTYEQRDRVRARMRAIVAQHLPGTEAEIRFEDSYPPMAPTEGNRKLLALYSQASADAGLGPVEAVPPGQRGAGDIQFVAPLVDSLDGLGASGRGAHSPDEDLDPASIERATIRTALLLYRLTR